MVVPAAFLYFQRSDWLIDYLIWVTVLNRGIRRYVDWLGGHFNLFSPISLTPLVISGFLFLLVLGGYRNFPAYVQRVFRFFAYALVIGLGWGLLRNGLSAVYAFAEYVAPLSIMGCAVMAGGNERILDRWIKTIGWAAVAASLYGWYQYYTIPPWDAFWVRAVGFEGYLGQLKPTQMVVFSTMSERAPFAGFLAFAVIPMIVSRRWRNITGWGAVILIVATILLTFVRTSLIIIMLAAILFPVLNRGKNTVQIMLLLGVIALAATYGLRQIPTSGKIGKRLQSLGSITQDGSFQGRIDIAGAGLGGLLRNPLGTGLGSAGLGGRVNTGALDANAAIGDNGYFEILYSFGVFGGAFFFYALWLIWKQVHIFERMGIRSETLMMFKALFVTGAIGLIAGNWLAGSSSAVFCIFAGFALFPKTALQRLAQARARQRAATAT